MNNRTARLVNKFSATFGVSSKQIKRQWKRLRATHRFSYRKSMQKALDDRARAQQA